VQKHLDHDQSRSLETQRETLADESDDLEVEFSPCGGGASGGDHLQEFSYQLLRSSRDSLECCRGFAVRTATTPNNLLLGSCILNAKEMRRMTTGLKAFSIWMKDTLKL
jgi:hypothetical protein